MATAIDLERTRELAASLDEENKLLRERLDTEKRTTQLLTELNTTREKETEALRAVIAAKNETIAARDALIGTQDKLIAELKVKRPSPWRRLGDILIGAGVIAVLR